MNNGDEYAGAWVQSANYGVFRATADNGVEYDIVVDYVNPGCANPTGEDGQTQALRMLALEEALEIFSPDITLPD